MEPNSGTSKKFSLVAALFSVIVLGALVFFYVQRGGGPIVPGGPMTPPPPSGEPSQVKKQMSELERLHVLMPQPSGTTSTQASELKKLSREAGPLPSAQTIQEQMDELKRLQAALPK